MREEMILAILRDLQSSSADIEASAVISIDGLMIAGILPAETDEDRVGAMSAAMITLGDRSAQELGRGQLEQVMVKGRNGYTVMIHIGAEAVLSVLAKANAKLGLVFLDAKRAAQSIAKTL